MELDKWLVHWFQINTAVNEEELLNSLESNYFEKGWMDSFKFVSFVMDIEAQFDISFSNDEFQNRDFSSIKGLSVIIKKHKEKNEK